MRVMLLEQGSMLRILLQVWVGVSTLAHLFDEA